MATSMTPSAMTDGQIERAIEIFRAQLRKHADELPSDAVQQVFGQPELGPEWLTVLRKRVEAISNMIVRRVTVNRNRTPQDMLDATGRNQYTDKGVVKAMPRGTGDEIEVVFFKVGRYLSDADLEKEYDLRGLKPTDPFSLCAVNEADPAFADEHPNGTHWQDVNGKWCYATFNRWYDDRVVNVYRNDNVWNDYWFFGGVRK